MHVEATTESPLSTAADTIALGIFDGEDVITTLPAAELRALLDSGEARSSLQHVALTHVGGRRVILVGLGDRDEFDPERARVAAAVTHRRARECGRRRCAGRSARDAGDEIAEGLVQGTVLAAYRFDRCKAPPTARRVDDDADDGAAAAASSA